MALQGVRVNFNGEVPILSAIIAEAERVGDLKIITVESHAQHVLVAFAEFPDGQVTLDATNSASISITDLSLVAPALYRLLWQVLGRQQQDRNFQRLPLTPAPAQYFSVRMLMASVIPPH